MNKEYHQRYNREHRREKSAWMWRKRHDTPPPPRLLHPNAKDYCVSCTTQISKELYLQNGNYCPKCSAQKVAPIKWEDLVEVEEVTKVKIEEDTLGFLTKNEKRRAFTSLGKKKSNVQVCHCGKKYIPTKTSADQCLFCFWGKLDK